MGKKLIVQRRGRGSSTFRATTHKRIAPACYPPPSEGVVYGVVEDLLHEPGRGAPLAKIRLESGESYYNVAVEDLYVGQRIAIGSGAPLEIGNVLPVGEVSGGTLVCNVERKPGDGGKLVRSSGTYSTIVAHLPQGTSLRLPSKRTMPVKGQCRVTIGVVAGGGRQEKPFLKAGERYHKFKAKGQKYPFVKGVSMASVSHPHGGGRHRHIGKPSTVSRNAPPGQKVGLIASKWTGRKKKMGGGRRR
ncbi:MAG: 50S ribosomal protein L2 [Candidatus Bathyarchaeia archaeon]